VHWEPLDSPYTQAKKAVCKLLAKVRAAFILLYSAWYMKPNHFQSGVDSIYKNLGWGLPFIPGITYAWGTQEFLGRSIEYSFSHFSPNIEHVIPHFSTLFLTMFFIGNDILIAAIIYFGAFFTFEFHSLMCRLGKIFGMRELPPPYEFFLVRTAGVFMWFSVAVCLMALPVLAQTPDLSGRLAARAFAFTPFWWIWMLLFLVAGLSWTRLIPLGAANKGRVGLKEMYKSDRFVKLVWWTQLALYLLTLPGLIFFVALTLSRH
jgi:hypothetical protein